MNKFPQRKIGDDFVSAMGLGYMGMAIQLPSRPLNDEESLKVLTAAADMGVTFWDTSDMYGPFTNEQLLGRWFKETGWDLPGHKVWDQVDRWQDDGRWYADSCQGHLRWQS